MLTTTIRIRTVWSRQPAVSWPIMKSTAFWSSVAEASDSNVLHENSKNPGVLMLSLIMILQSSF